MRQDVVRLVESYIDAVRRNDPDAFPLRPNIVFERPLNIIKGIAEFRRGLADCFPIVKSIEVVRLVADDESCAAVLNLDTTFGVLPFVELFHVVDGQIVSIRAYYDPRPIVEGMSRPPAQ